MYERCLSEAERILASRKEIVVPVRTVWREVVRQSKRQKFEIPAIADFTAMLEADPRFEFIPAHESVAETAGLPQDENDTEELELETLGFFGEDGVKLRQLKFGDVEEEDKEQDEDAEALSSPPWRLQSSGSPRSSVNQRHRPRKPHQNANAHRLRSRKRTARRRARKAR